jgi:hypothetical protein
MTDNELKRKQFLEKHEERIRLQWLNYLAKNDENLKNDQEVPKKLLAEIAELENDLELGRVKIKQMKLELLEKEQKEKKNGFSRNTENQLVPSQETELPYMYPISNNVKNQLYTGTVVVT